MGIKEKSTQGLTFWIKNHKRWINIETSVKEFDNGRVVISVKCKNECVGKIETTVNNFNIVSKYSDDTDDDIHTPKSDSGME